MTRLGTTLAVAALLAAAPGSRADDAAITLMRVKCVACHGPDKQAGGLRLDTAAGMKAGGDTGPDLTLITRAIQGGDPDVSAMPPKQPLSPTEIATLTKWLKSGAPLPQVEPQTLAKTTVGPVGDAFSDPRNPVRKAFGGDRLDLWSLKKPVRPVVPAVDNASQSRNPVDAFIVAKLAAAGLTMSPEADRRTLIRRLTFDLTGLPPTPAAVAAFVADTSPGAYEALVDRLLASPAYGERAARLWLDVVRYADTNGYERDEFRPEMWRYRDYVIRAMNADKPFDRFAREQLAGDELVTGSPRTAADADALIATGFLRLGQYDSTRAIFDKDGDERGRDDLLTDLANTTAAAFLGVTVSCCQCHDHKYDPLTQADHFRLRAFFAGVKFRDDLPIALPAAVATVKAHNAALDWYTAPARRTQARLLAEARAQLVARRMAWVPAVVRAQLDQPNRKPDAATQAKLKKVRAFLAVSDDQARDALSGPARKRFDAAGEFIAQAQAKKQSPVVAAGVTDVGPTAPPTPVYAMGDVSQPRGTAEPGFFSVFTPHPAAVTSPRPNTTGRRSALADWVASTNNPWTARVLVNRLWQQHFGTGLVATPNDFGLAGARPSHPELLDWLATEVVARGWSVKAMHKLLVLSATYRQASADRPAAAKVDPDNTLVWRQSVRRLDAEMVRDALLATADVLKPHPDGKPVWPPVPEFLLTAQPGILEAIEGHDDGRRQNWYTDPPDKVDVRSVYLVRKRVLPVPFLQAFDLPESAVSCGRRGTTVVAPQALALLNSPEAGRYAQAFADAVAAAAGVDRAKQVEFAFGRALQRPPSTTEAKQAAALLTRHTAAHSGEPNASRQALSDLCLVLLNVNEFVYID